MTCVCGVAGTAGTMTWICCPGPLPGGHVTIIMVLELGGGACIGTAIGWAGACIETAGGGACIETAGSGSCATAARALARRLRSERRQKHMHASPIRLSPVAMPTMAATPKPVALEA